MSNSVKRPLAPCTLDGQPAAEVVVGRMYLVPMVRGLFQYWRRRWPVLGPKHEDADYIGFEHEHYHFDWRFVDRDVFDTLYYDKLDGHILFAWALTDLRNQIPLGPVIWRRRKCHRPMPDFPRHLPMWLLTLEAAYADRVLTDALVCPHRGVALGGLARDTVGCVVCPLHGLRWNLETRRLVRDD